MQGLTTLPTGVSDGPIFSLAREKIGEKRVLLLKNRRHVSTL